MQKQVCSLKSEAKRWQLWHRQVIKRSSFWKAEILCKSIPTQNNSIQCHFVSTSNQAINRLTGTQQPRHLNPPWGSSLHLFHPQATVHHFYNLPLLCNCHHVGFFFLLRWLLLGNEACFFNIYSFHPTYECTFWVIKLCRPRISVG